MCRFESHYFLCVVNSCPKDGCRCKFGFVLTPDGECIAKKDCGCTTDERLYRPPGMLVINK